MTMTRTNSIVLGAAGVALLIAAHGVVAWGGLALSAKAGRWLPWIGGGAVAFGLYHVVQAFGMYHVVQHFRGNGRGHRQRPDRHVDGRGSVERGPHDGFLINLGHGFVELTVCETGASPRFRPFFYDKGRQARTLPRNATITVETVRHGDSRQTFDCQAQGDYMESTSDVPPPHSFKAVVHVSHGSHTHTHELQFPDHVLTHRRSNLAS